MENKIMYGEAKVQQTKSYPNFKGKYFVYLPDKRFENIGGSKGIKIAYRIEVLGVTNSKPRGKFMEMHENSLKVKEVADTSA